MRTIVLLLTFAYGAAHGSEIDARFRLYAEKLPQPATISEANGACFTCAKHGSPTYSHLGGIASRLPLRYHEDLLEVIPWLRHEDACIRQIAATAIASRVGVDPNDLGVYYYRIVLALKAFLDKIHLEYNRALLDSMLVDVAATPLSAYLAGTWEEPVRPRRNIFLSLKMEGDLIHLSSRFPSRPSSDHTSVSKIKEVTTNDQRQYIISCQRHQERTTSRDIPVGSTPSFLSYIVWPISNDVMWLKSGPRWVKLKRAQPQSTGPLPNSRPLSPPAVESATSN